MQSSNVKEGITKHCVSHCCLNPTPSFPNSFDHQNSNKIANSSTFQYDFATATTSSLYPHTHFTNPESLPALHDSFIQFSRSLPLYLNTVELDQLRQIHYPNLTTSSHVCLDYAGHALFSFSQIHRNEFVASSSSSSPCSRVTHFEICHKSKGVLALESDFESKIKTRIMRYLNLSEDDYFMFFAANQTSSFQVLAECYPFKSNKNLITVYDHENEAVEAMVEGSKNRGARVLNAEFKWPKLKIHSRKLEEMIVGRNKSKECKRKGKGLFVFPLQSRVSGARYSYQWMNMAQQNGWHVLLDATGLGPKDMDTLGLSMFQPDFLICTFFKVFGDDPSGFSCLFVRKSTDPILTQSDILSKVGIVSLIDTSNSKIPQSSRYPLSDNVYDIGSDTDQVESEELEVECRGLDHADALGLALIGTRTRCLVNWLVNALQTLSHPHSEKGDQLVTIYGPRVRFDRGPTLAFNIFDWKGEKIVPSLVQKLADRRNISLGCGYIKHVWFSERYECDKIKVLGSHKGKKSVRNSECGISVVMVHVSFLNNFEDVYKLWEFVASFLDADFVEKERWRYTALNQRTIEV